MLACASRDTKVSLWDLTMLEVYESDISEWLLCHLLAGHTAEVLTVAFSPDGLLLVSGSLDGTLKFWDPIKRTMLHSFQTMRQINDVKFSPDGNTIVTGGPNGSVLI